jgi:Fur family transcriptional regulator, ferric uptake regulator
MKRETQQKNSIWKALSGAGRPLTVREVLDIARKETATLGIATVYRNIKYFQEEGFIAEVELPGQTPRWEIKPVSHHHHFLCRNCDKIFEIKDCPEDLNRLLPAGYTLEEHEIFLKGICKNCNRKPK